MADDLVLKVGGQAFAGWTAVTVDRGLDALAGCFQIALTERFPGHPEKWVLAPGQACEVMIGSDKVLTGWIDNASYRLTANDHSVAISGRDKTCDLVDCSAVHKPGSWAGRRLEQIAADLAKPFGIKVSAKVSTGAAFSFALQQGETVFEATERMARQRGVLSVTDGDGDLVFLRPGSVRGGYSLQEGVNIKEVTFTNDVKDRFSQYILKGQAGGGDFLLGASAHQPKASAEDAGVTRYRPLMIINEDASSGASLADRARWEASVRAGRAQQVIVTVVGWRDPSGALYVADRLVTVKAPTIGVDAELLVTAVRFSLSAAGAVTELTLSRKEAFSLVALPPKKKGKKGKGVDPLIGLE